MVLPTGRQQYRGEIVVPLTGETSNKLFEVFEDWHHQLQHVDFDKLELVCDAPQDVEEPQP